VLSFLARYDIEIDQAVIDDVYSNSNYPLKETVEDVQGRLTLILSRPSDSHKAITIQRNSSNDFISTVYSRAYNPDLNPSIPVPVSANRLVPDYLNTHYMHPLQGTEIVKIRLSGNRDIDFARARQELGISLAEEDATNYVWHHMDDFDEVNGEAYCTMQLVRREAHNGTGVTGMQHSGSAAQWRAYYESGY
ncbi:MAG: HNH endonuclease, partial [Saprospiraceae bacterium]|nr:HNH endonuclease [Saprospiraceae bacterium]